MKNLMKEVSFTVSEADRELIKKIMDRACAKGFAGQPDPLIPRSERLDVTMSITAVHANGCPLDLQRWLDADDFNFTHDVIGIARHINTETGGLNDFFRPRFCRRDGQ